MFPYNTLKYLLLRKVKHKILCFKLKYHQNLTRKHFKKEYFWYRPHLNITDHVDLKLPANFVGTNFREGSAEHPVYESLNFNYMSRKSRFSRDSTAYYAMLYIKI